MIHFDKKKSCCDSKHYGHSVRVNSMFKNSCFLRYLFCLKSYLTKICITANIIKM